MTAFARLFRSGTMKRWKAEAEMKLSVEKAKRGRVLVRLSYFRKRRTSAPSSAA